MNYISIFTKFCINRYFELEVVKAHQQGYINIPIYLSIGQDHIPAVISEICIGWPLFPQHRCHSWCLSWGMDPKSIVKELLGRKDGCNKGMGGSASLASKKHKIFGHSGLLGDQVPIAVGYAQASQTKTIVILGDAAAEEDYVLASLGCAATHKVPILFICEDNNLSILTEKRVRRSWNLQNIARSMEIPSYNIDDDIEQVFNTTLIATANLPAFININTKRHMWHAGSGKDYEPNYDQFTKYFYIDEKHTSNIKSQTQEYMEKLWKQLPTQ